MRRRSRVVRMAGCAALIAVATSVATATSASARPANDDRVAPTPLVAGTTLRASNIDATTEPGEVDLCAGVRYGRTIWFSWRADEVGDLRVDLDAALLGTAFDRDTVAALYRAGDPAPLLCNVDADIARGPARIETRLQPGDYLIQVGSQIRSDETFAGGAIIARALFTADLDLDRDLWTRPGDCRDDDPAIHPGVVDIPDDPIDQDCDGRLAVDLDRDDDGDPRPADCDDADPRRHHDAVEVPRSRADEDCDGFDGVFDVIPARILIQYRRRAAGLVVQSLVVRQLPAGSVVEIRCRPRRCLRRPVRRAFARRTRAVQLKRLVRRVVLVRGRVLEVRVVAPEMLGRVRLDAIRRNGAVDTRGRCLDPRRSGARVGSLDASLKPRRARRGEECL